MQANTAVSFIDTHANAPDYHTWSGGCWEICQYVFRQVRKHSSVSGVAREVFMACIVFLSAK